MTVFRTGMMSGVHSTIRLIILDSLSGPGFYRPGFSALKRQHHGGRNLASMDSEFGRYAKCFTCRAMPWFKQVKTDIPWVCWTFAGWLALGCAAYGLSNDLGQAPWRWLLVLTMPSAAVIFAWLSLRAEAGRVARIVFWMITIAGGALCYALVHDQLLPTSGNSWQLTHTALFTVSGILPILALMLVIVRETKSRALKISEVAFSALLGGVYLVALTSAARFCWVRGYVQPLREKAVRSWAEVGRPMPEFEKSIAVQAENDSLRELTRDLKPFGVVTFYKTGSGKGAGQITATNSIELPREVLNCLYSSSLRSAGDRLEMPSEVSAQLEARRHDFDNLYAGVLKRDAPVWKMNPYDGCELVVPNFLAARSLAQWIYLDACHHLAMGDERGAITAVSAGLRVTQNFGEQPILVSNMIRAAIQALFAPVIARLPEDPGALQGLAAEVDAQRRGFLRTVQLEAWGPAYTIEVLYKGDDVGANLYTMESLPHGLHSLTSPLLSIECSNDWLDLAETVQIMGDVRDRASTDLGIGELEAAINRHPSPLTPNLGRAWLRLNGSFLVREQAEIIRMARGEMQAGKDGNLGSYQSAVVPGSKWEISGDAAANSISVKLSPRPGWTKSDVFDSGFFLLPLDGSASWKLAENPLRQASR
jgi:hypothetical protein